MKSTSLSICHLVETISLEDSADPILDLTWLLTTERPSEALADFLGSGEQMSERVRFDLFSRTPLTIIVHAGDPQMGNRYAGRLDETERLFRETPCTCMPTSTRRP